MLNNIVIGHFVVWGLHELIRAHSGKLFSEEKRIGTCYNSFLIFNSIIGVVLAVYL